MKGFDMTHDLVGKYVLIDAKVFWTKGQVVGYNEDPWDRDDLDEERFFIVEGHDEAGNTGIHRLREDELTFDQEQDYFLPPEDDEIDWDSYIGDDLLGIKVEILRPVRKHGFVVDYSEENDTYGIEMFPDPHRGDVAYFSRNDFEITEDNE